MFREKKTKQLVHTSFGARDGDIYNSNQLPAEGLGSTWMGGGGDSVSDGVSDAAMLEKAADEIFSGK